MKMTWSTYSPSALDMKRDLGLFNKWCELALRRLRPFQIAFWIIFLALECVLRKLDADFSLTSSTLEDLRS